MPSPLTLDDALTAMHGGPYDQGDGLLNARKLVEAGAVTSHGATFLVRGRTQTYEVGETCACEDFTLRKHRHCYHRAAAYLYQACTQTLDTDPLPSATENPEEPSLPLGPATVDERLAQASQLSPQVQDIPLSPDAEPLPIPAPPALPLPRGRLLRPLHAILADLRRPLPDACIPFLTIKNQKVRYVHWYQVTHLLDMYAPGWQVEVVRYDEMKGATVTVRLTLICAEGKVSRDAIGREDEDEVDYGNKATNAYAQALKRAAALFGVDWLYDHDGMTRATDAHLLAEQESRLKTLGKACEEARINKETYLVALKALAGVRRWEQIPVAMWQEALACVEAYVERGREVGGRP